MQCIHLVIVYLKFLSCISLYFLHLLFAIKLSSYDTNASTDDTINASTDDTNASTDDTNNLSNSATAYIDMLTSNGCFPIIYLPTRVNDHSASRLIIL